MSYNEGGLTMQFLRSRMHKFIRETGAKVISVETLSIRAFDDSDTVNSFNTMFMWNKLKERSYGGMQGVCS